jgi:hypothetical protein
MAVPTPRSGDFADVDWAAEPAEFVQILDK